LWSNAQQIEEKFSDEVAVIYEQEPADHPALALSLEE
jgi:hypothetical protein